MKKFKKNERFLSNCGKFFAVGGADAIVSIWDAEEFCPIRTMSRLEWPVRTLSFSYNSGLLAAASEDHIIDICNVRTVFSNSTKYDYDNIGSHGEFGGASSDR